MPEAMSSVLLLPNKKLFCSLSLSLSLSLPVIIMKGLIPVVECCVLLYAATTCGRYLSQSVMVLEQYTLSIVTNVLFCLSTSPFVFGWFVVEFACAMWDLFMSSFVRSPTKALPLSDWKVIGQPYRISSTLSSDHQFTPPRLSDILLLLPIL